MKIFLTIVLLFGASFAQELVIIHPNSSYEQQRLQCLSESNVNPNNASNRYILSLEEMENDHSLKCFDRCMRIKFKDINESNQHISYHDIEMETYEACYAETENVSDKCEQHFQIISCLNRKIKEKYQRKIDLRDQERLQCLSEANLDSKTSEDIDSFSVSEIKDNYKLKCYKRCMDIKSNVINEENEYIFQNWASQNYNACRLENDNVTDKCEQFYEINLCLFKQVMEESKKVEDQIAQQNVQCMSEAKIDSKTLETNDFNDSRLECFRDCININLGVRSTLHSACYAENENVSDKCKQYKAVTACVELKKREEHRKVFGIETP